MMGFQLQIDISQIDRVNKRFLLNWLFKLRRLWEFIVEIGIMIYLRHDQRFHTVIDVLLVC